MTAPQSNSNTNASIDALENRLLPYFSDLLARGYQPWQIVAACVRLLSSSGPRYCRACYEFASLPTPVTEAPCGHLLCRRCAPVAGTATEKACPVCADKGRVA